MLLDDATIRALIDATVDLGLDRDALLAGVHPRYVASLPIAESEAAQILSDLHEMNGVPRLNDGSVPLRVWLGNAVDLADPRPQTAVFEGALTALAGGNDPGTTTRPEEPATTSPGRPTAGELGLTGRQWQALNEALASAFNYRTFEQMLRFQLDKDLEQITLANDLFSVVYDVIEAAEREGWTAELIAAARAQNPGSPALRLVATDLDLAPRGYSATELERIVVPDNGFVDFMTWSAGLFEIEGRVGRVELAGNPLGTAFLVAADVVLTNHHVVRGVIADPSKAEHLKVRFDYKRRHDAGQLIHAGTIFGLAADWLLAHQPHSSADTAPAPTAPPSPDELDFALLRLQPDAQGRLAGRSPVGGRAIAADLERGWIALPALDPEMEAGQTLLIVQHPSGDPLTLAIDTDGVIGLNDNGTRLRYRTNTEPGSSGSPYFNARLELVALHQAGDPNYAELHQPGFNQGIPVAALRPHLERLGSA